MRLVSVREVGVVLLGLFASLVLAVPGQAIYDPQTFLAGGGASSLFIELQISPDGRFAVFTAERDTAGQRELYQVRLDGTEATPVKINTTPPANGDVSAFAIAPDSSRVVYNGDLAVDEEFQMYSAPLDGPGGQIKLSSSALAGRRITGDVRIAPDASRVVYAADLDTDGVTELYSAPLDRSDGQRKLSTTRASGGNVSFGFEISPDSSRVVYQGDLDTDEMTELYSAPLDRPDGQDKLSATPVAGGAVTRYAIAPDSSRVVYTGDLDTDDVFELYSAPLDQSARQIKLTSTPVGGGDVSFQVTIAPDSSRVVYNGDLDTDDVRELYSAPLGEPGGQIRLSTTPVTGGNVFEFTIAPDSSRVAYAGDLIADEVGEVFTAPLDRGGQQIKVSSTPVAGGRVQSEQLLIAPDSSRVVYVGDLGAPGVFELYSAALDQPGQQTRLSTEPVAGGDVNPYRARIAPDGTRVIYPGDLTSDEVSELYSAPLDQPDQQTRINTPPVVDGDIDDQFRIAPDSAFVVYTGDLRTDGLLEVYASGVGQMPPRAVTDLAATDIVTDAAAVTWTPPAFGSRVESYRVTTDPARRRATTTVDGDATTTTLTGLSPDTTYTVTVIATNDGGDSPPASTTFTTAPPPTAGGVVRLSGETRFDTAAAIALDRFDPADVDVVYLATGRNFPDALAGGPLAARMGAPILLVEPDALPDITRTTLSTLDPDRVIALGGPIAVTDAVLDLAGSAGTATTSRLAGDNRYATASAIADALLAAGGDATRAFLAIGTNFPDAVAAGPATAGAPILLTRGATLAPETQTWLAANTPATVTAVGGADVLANDTLAAAGTAAGGTTARLAGDTRYTTATDIAATLGAAADAPDTVYIAVGTNFPDALTGGPAAAAEHAPIVLTAGGAFTLPEDTAAYLDDLPALRRIVVLGGTTAIPPEILTQLNGLLD